MSGSRRRGANRTNRLVGFVTPLTGAFGVGDSTVTQTQVSAIIMAGAALIAYIIGEGLVDSSQTESTTPKRKRQKARNRTMADEKKTFDGIDLTKDEEVSEETLEE